MRDQANASLCGARVPLCSIIVVNYNGARHLGSCLSGFEASQYPEEGMEILVVDTGSTDGAETGILAAHTRARLLRCPQNNFAAALNQGIAASRGGYVVFANNDVFVRPDWIATLVDFLQQNPAVGCAGGKLLLSDGRINSAGHRALPDFYFDDEGFGDPDKAQYDRRREVDGLCWAAVMFRKACLDQLGAIDEDYVFYYEDVDTSLRCRQLGWKLMYVPEATAVHAFHGAAQCNHFAEYFCARSRLVYVAKHYPEKLPAAVLNSRFARARDKDQLMDILPAALKKLEGHAPETAAPVGEELRARLVPVLGELALDHLQSRMTVIRGERRIRVALYDQALHLIGGGQKWGCVMAKALQDEFDVTFLCNYPVELHDLEGWYGMNLGRCRIQRVPLPYFEQRGGWIDANVVTPEMENPFDAVSRASRNFDIFVIVNQLPLIEPLSPFSIFTCHFPDTRRRCYFAVDEYSCLVVNSRYTGSWVRRLWAIEPDFLIYPPVDMEAPPAAKENLILSVARFEPGGSKKQTAMLRAFGQLWHSAPQQESELRSWRLVLAGGSMNENPYLREVQALAKKTSAPVEVRVNASHAELKDLYARASIFWHACGLQESNPQLVEHFGMTTVEAMQSGCAPVVINGGGQAEIVEHGQSGFRFDTLEELGAYTRQLIGSPELLQRMQKAARERGLLFSQPRFEQAILNLFRAVATEYGRVSVPDPQEVIRKHHRPALFLSAAARRER